MGHYDDQYEEEAKLKSSQERRIKSDAIDFLQNALSSLRGQHPTTRAISIAITHIETAILWLQKSS